MCGRIILNENLDHHKFYDMSYESESPDYSIGHNRLTIIDLNSRSNPFYDNENRYIMSYNGEIYKIKKIR